MKAKEKAKELVCKMKKDFQYFASKEIAKQHALIAVDEIEEAVRYLDDDSEDFWYEVKQEIEKL